MSAPLILFGAFDRHNFGDLLLGEIGRALFPDRPTIFAGLVERDMRGYGGRRVRAIAALAREWGGRPAEILHVGGEILSCSLYQAAVMLQDEAAALAAIARYDREPAAARTWAAATVGLDQAIAYLVPRTLFEKVRWIGHMGIGGADWETLPAPMREQAVCELRRADHVWVRDAATHAHLSRSGIEAELAPDPAVLTRRLFAARIETRMRRGEVRALRERFANGYLAVQMSADFGDDATLVEIGHQLATIHAATGLGIVPFCAGRAPWHDDPSVYRRLLARMNACQTAQFASSDLWDICALLAASQGYAGSSLHGRIVAQAFGRPAVGLMRTPQGAAKLSAYAHTWQDGAAVHLAMPATLAETVFAALRQHDTAEDREKLDARCEAAVAALRASRERLKPTSRRPA